MKPISAAKSYDGVILRQEALIAGFAGSGPDAAVGKSCAEEPATVIQAAKKFLQNAA